MKFAYRSDTCRRCMSGMLTMPASRRKTVLTELGFFGTCFAKLVCWVQANNKYQEVFTSSIDELDRRILMQGVSYE